MASLPTVERQVTPPVRIGPFRLDPARRSLTRDGVPVPVQPKALELLIYMVANPGRVLLKSELLSALWPDSFVEESNLSQNVFQLRKALGNGEAKFVRTVSGRGYIFIGDVEVERPDTPVLPSGNLAALPPDGTVADTAILSPGQSRPVTQPAAAAAGRKEWWVAGAVAVLAVSLATGYFWRARHRSTVLPVRHRVVLAEFSNLTSDPDLGHTLQSALRMSLEQSRYFTVLSERDTAVTLREMRRSPDDPLTSMDVASEICERNGQSSVLHGSVVRLGTRYQLGLEARECSSQRLLAASKVMSDTQDGLLTNLDSLIDSVRRQAGEPAWSGSIDANGKYVPPSTAPPEADAPLEQVTTHSMEALKAFVQGDYYRARGDTFQSIALYRQAIAIDPGFAMAYARLGSRYETLHEDKSARESYERAYELSQRGGLFPRERLYIQTHYSSFVTGDLNATIATYLTWTTSFPDDAHPWINISDCYGQLGEYEEATNAGRNAVRLAPFQGNAWIALANEALHSGKTAEAHAACERSIATHLDGWEIHDVLFRLAVLANDKTAQAAQLAWARGKPGEYESRYDEAWLAMRGGRVKQALGLFREARSMALGEHAAGAAARQSALIAVAMAAYGYPAEARASLAEAGNDAPASDIAFAAAATLDTVRARKLLDGLRRNSPQDTLVQTFETPRTTAQLQLAEHQDRAAMDTLAGVGTVRMRDYSIPVLAGEASLAAGDFGAAREQFTRVPANPGIDPLSPDLELAQLGLARSLAALHDTAGAKAAYAKLFADWHEADADLPVLRAARSEAAALQ